MATTIKYDWKKTLGKLMWGFGYVFVSGIIYVFTDRPEAAFAVPVLMALQNYLKHKQNITWL